MTDEFAAGDDEVSFVKIATRRLRAHRQARGTFEGFDVVAGVYPLVENGERTWESYVKVYGDLGKEAVSRTYKSRGDAYRSFEFLIEEHDLEEVEESRGEDNLREHVDDSDLSESAKRLLRSFPDSENQD